MDKRRIDFLIIEIVLIIGMLISLFLLYEHFSVTGSGLCNLGGNLDCGVVNKSPYATLDGITYFLTFDLGLNLPVIDLAKYSWLIGLIEANAFLGFLILLIKFFMLSAHRKRKHFYFIKPENILVSLRILAMFSFLYGLFLIYIQHSVLKTYCIFCLMLDVILLIVLIFVWKEKKLILEV